MKAIIIFNKGSNNSESQIFPFTLFRAQLKKNLDFSFTARGVGSLSEIDVDDVNSYDVAFIQLKIKKTDSRQLHGLLEKITAKKVILDDYDSAGKNAFKYLPLIDLYVKKQTLRALGDYDLPSAHGQRHADIIAGNRDARQQIEKRMSAANQQKLISGWNISTGQGLHRLYESERRRNSLRNARTNDISARFSLRALSPNHWHNTHRELCEKKVLELKTKHTVTTASERIKLAEYQSELRNSKISVSPWGFGEVCTKDFESVMFGALLVKPDMGHVETQPNIYVPYKTYIPVRPDFSDLREICEYYLTHEDERLRIAEAAFRAYAEYFEKATFVLQVRDMLARLDGDSFRLMPVKNHRTGTSPMVYHETGKPKRNSPLLRLAAFIAKQPPRNLSCPSDLTIVTWNNYPDESLLEKECTRLGIPLKVYGKDVPEWKSNYESKKRLMYEACCKETTKYIMGVDSRDLLFLTSPAVILDEFKRMNVRVLFGGTIHTSGFYSKAKDLNDFFDGRPEAKTSPFYNLNGGQWIAERAYAKEFFERTLAYPPRPEKPSSDQMILAHTLCHNKEFHDTVRIDSECRIFQIYTEDSPITFGSRMPAAHFQSIRSYLDTTVCFACRKAYRKALAQADRCVGLVGIAIRSTSPDMHRALRRMLFKG